MRRLSQDRLRAWASVTRKYHFQRHTTATCVSSGTSHLDRTRRRPILTTSSFHSSVFLSNEDQPNAEEIEPNPEVDAKEEPHPTDIKYHFTQPPPLSESSQKKVDDLFEKILWLDMVEVHLLTQLVNENLGIKWSEMDNSGGPVSSGSTQVATAEEVPAEKALKDVKLVGFDEKAKIKVIKEVRAIAGLGLKEAKELVESAPKILQKELKPEKAEELKAQLEAVGAQVEIV